MKNVASRPNWCVLGVLVPTLGWFALLPTPVWAQSVGNKTVYQCPGGSCSLAASTVYVDASEFLPQYGPDICDTINGILTHVSQAVAHLRQYRIKSNQRP
jgi:hypothetical protein